MTRFSFVTQVLNRIIGAAVITPDPIIRRVFPKFRPAKPAAPISENAKNKIIRNRKRKKRRAGF